MLILNGLRIETAAGGETTDKGADLVWRTERVDALPAEPEAGNPIAIVRGLPTSAGTATDHIFGYDGKVRCRFRIGADGSTVGCQALPEVSDRDLFSLFAEPVMRSVLVRRVLLSFHAAALAKDGRAILVMADKGAGKSTLSWALQDGGWQLLADDLARVDRVDGVWSVFPGHRQTKLTPAAARAFGYAAEAMPERFDDPGPAASAALFDKRIIDAPSFPDDPKAAIPLAALCLLTARHPSAPAVQITALRPFPAVRGLIEHATRDPIGDVPALPPALQNVVGELATSVRTVAVTLPDRFDRLVEAETALSELIADRRASA